MYIDKDDFVLDGHRSGAREAAAVKKHTLRSRLVEVLESSVSHSDEFSTEDPLGLVRDLEASGRFHRDTGPGRIFHPGRISFRERKPVEALHILIDENRVSAHIDKHSPLSLRDAGSRYSLARVFVHNITGMGEDLARLVTGRWGRQRCELECEPVTLDGRRIDDLLQRPRSADFVTDVGPGSGEAPLMNEGGMRKVPFSVIDEAVHLLDTDAAPWSIQLEVRVSGRLDEHRLREALQQALGRHSMAHARKVASRRTKHLDMWKVDPRLEVDPLRVIECPDDAAVQSVRSDLQSLAVPLSESPPLRARLAKNPEGDVLMLNVNHAATDGFGALRILRSIARAYAGEPDPIAKIDFLAARDLPERLAAANISTKMRRYAALAEKLRDLVRPPARMAPEGATGDPGYGFHLERLSVDDTQTVLQIRRPGNVDDVLATALHLAIAEWNERRGAPCGRIGVLVPANLRPPRWRHEMVGNFSLPARISTGRRNRRDPVSALYAVTAQTTRKKRSGMGTALIEVMKVSRRLPLWVKQASIAILPLTGNRLVDTAMISNLGRLDDPPAFGPQAGKTTELWFSAPARMPLGLSVGAATVHDRLHLAFRYRHRMFGPDSARRFARCYLGQLHKIAEESAKVPSGDSHSLVVQHA